MSKVSKFDTAVHEETVKEIEVMAERFGGDISAAAAAKGSDYFTAHGELHPLVQVFKQMKVSHNSLESFTGGKYRLTNGIAMPVLTWFDLTGSVGRKVAEVLKALGLIYNMSAPFRTRYNIQMAHGGLQDNQDEHGPIMMTQFETDNRIGDQLQLIVPDLSGDDHIEEYIMAMIYTLLACDLDINSMYGLRGHLRIIGDEIGYDGIVPPPPKVTGETVTSYIKKWLGFQVQSTTAHDVCQQLFSQWLPVYLNIGSEDRAPRADVTRWWQNTLGAGWVMEVHEMDLLDESLVGVMYVLETAKPTIDGLTTVLRAEGANTTLGSGDIKSVWQWLQALEPHFGEQTKCANFDTIPMPGAIMSDMRFAWPDDDPRAKGQLAFPGAATKPDDLLRKPERLTKRVGKWESTKF